MAEKKADAAPHPDQAHIQLCAVGCPDQHAAKLAAAGLNWQQIRQVIAFVQAHGTQLRDVWGMVAELLTILKGQPEPPA
jgi:hypothetical protein